MGRVFLFLFVFFFSRIFSAAKQSVGFKRLSTWIVLLVAAHFLGFKWFQLGLDLYLSVYHLVWLLRKCRKKKGEFHSEKDNSLNYVEWLYWAQFSEVFFILESFIFSPTMLGRGY